MFGYSTYGNPSTYQGGGYSANPVSSGDSLPYGDQPAGGGQSPNPSGGGYGGYSMAPATGGYSGGSGGDSGGGMNANVYMALANMASNFLQNAFTSGDRKQAALAAIPDGKYMGALGGMMTDAGLQGELLKQSSLSPRAIAAARTAGARAADQRGLGGPLAASVSSQAETDAQGNYDQWRQNALTQARGGYMQLIQAYMAALQQRRSAVAQYNAASANDFYSKIPLFGGLAQATGLGNDAYGTVNMPNSQNIATF